MAGTRRPFEQTSPSSSTENRAIKSRRLERCNPRYDPETPEYGVPKSEQVEATISSWEAPYEHGSATTFLKTINRCYGTYSGTMNAHYIEVVQSSGTGKSRMLHEVCGVVFGVVINFGRPGSGMRGFPRPDIEVRDYFTQPSTPRNVEAQVTHFFIALFDNLRHKDFENPYEMQQFLGYGNPQRDEDRRAFFEQVIKQAERMQIEWSTPTGGLGRLLPPVIAKGDSRSLSDAADKLCKNLLSATHITSQVKLILGFDEAGKMAREDDSTAHLDVFTQIRRVLHSMRASPIFGVFMSTTAPTCQFHQRQAEDRSSRMPEEKLHLWAPYTLIGFDQLATKLKSGCSLDDVTTIDFMLGLGRPLFKTRYVNGTDSIKEGIVEFAIEKLLNGSDSGDLGRKIAPLAMRLPLAFNVVTPSGRAAEESQVESHMRLCLGILNDVEAMYTIAPSEPILNEAAARVMARRETRSRGSSVGVLREFLADRFLSKDDRGDLAIMLLMHLAHDRVCDPSTLSFESKVPPPIPYNRPIRVLDFLTNLFAEYHHEKLLGARAALDGETLEKTFSESWMHFTHFIKATDHKVVNRKFLMRAMVRGAAILCADNQLGIDMVLPYTFRGKQMTEDNIGAILGQIKNIPGFNTPQKTILAKMEPRKIGVFEKTFKVHPPIIKLVLSVGASSTSAMFEPRQFPSRPSYVDDAAPPPSFELFAAGLSHATFLPIIEYQESTWADLVSRSGVEDFYNDKIEADMLPIVRRMTPCAQADVEHWGAFFPLEDVESILENPSGSDESDLSNG